VLLAIHFFFIVTGYRIKPSVESKEIIKDLPEDIIEEIGEHEDLGNRLYVVCNIGMVYPGEASIGIKPRYPCFCVRNKT